MQKRLPLKYTSGLFLLRTTALILVMQSSLGLQAAPLCRSIYYSEYAESALKAAARPSTEKLLDSDPESIVSHLTGKVQIAEDPKFYKLLEAVTSEVLAKYEGQKIFFVARDGEWLYDAMQTVLYQTPNGQALLPKMHLLNLSRPLTQNASAPVLMKYLKANGVNVEAIIAGKEKVTLIDTGERGSIFISALQKIIETQDFSGPNWKTKLSNLLNGFEVKLLHSSMAENRATVLKSMLDAKQFDKATVIQKLHSLGFGTIASSSLAKIGIPKDHYSLHKWIVTEFERRLHWFGRATKVSPSGQPTGFQEVDRNPVAALYSQAQILSYFTQPEVLTRVESNVGKAIKKCGAGCEEASVSQPAVAKSTAKVKPNFSELYPTAPLITAGLKLEAGQVVRSPAKRYYEVIAYVDSGVRGSVYKAKDLETGDTVAIKLAVNKDADTVKSFAEEKEKNKGYVLAGFKHAKLLEIGQDYMVKEFVLGTRADAWLDGWIKEGMPTGTEHVQALATMLKTAAQEGIYVGDLNPKNLIWNGSDWVVVDSGTWRNDLATSEILERYNDKVVGRWTKKLDNQVGTTLREQLGLQ